MADDTRKSHKAILTVSIQGAGKSTYAKYLEKRYPNIKRASKDDLRFMLYDTNDYNQKYEKNTQRFGLLLDEMHKKVISIILQQDLIVVVDETHHNKAERHAMKKYLLSLYPDIKIEAHYLYSQFDRCWRRNIARRPEQIVPKEVMWRYYEELVASLGGSAEALPALQTLTDEGFDGVEYIDAEEHEANWNYLK